MINTKVKICGLSRTEDIHAVNECLPDFIGFVFAPSPRQISLAQAAILRAELDTRIKAVGVFVDASIEDIVSAFEMGVIDMVQLHGNEDSYYIEELKSAKLIPVIKALKLNPQGTLLQEVPPNADYLLFDAQSPGCGTRFAWDEQTISALRRLRRSFMLAGGINLENLEEVLALNPWGIDVSSGVESCGKKNRGLIRKLVFRVQRKDSPARPGESEDTKEQL